MIENLPISLLDIGVLVVLLIGGLIGLVLGFVRAGLFVISWLGAGLATLFGLPIAKVFARKHIEEEFLADLASGVGIFLVTLIILFLISSLIGGWVRGSRLNSLDRSLGMVAGFITSIFLLSGAYLFMENVLPEDKRLKFVKNAKSLPMISVTARVLSESLMNKFNYFSKHSFNQTEIPSKEAINKKIFDRLVLPEAKKAENETPPGYDKKERSNLERAIDLFNSSSQ